MKNKKKNIFFVILLALLCAAGYPNIFFSAPLLLLLVVGALYYFSFVFTSHKQCFLFTLWTYTLGFSGALYWLSYPIHITGGLPILLSAFCVVLLSSYLALYPALSILLFRLIRTTFIKTEAPYSFNILLFCSLFFALLYTGGELLCSVLFTGFPWLSLGTAFAPLLSWVQSAHLVGALGLSFFYVFCSALLFSTLLCGSKIHSVFCVGISSMLLLANALYGHTRLQTVAEATGSSLQAYCIQGNTSLNVKWNDDFFYDTTQKYIRLSVEALKNSPQTDLPSLIVWPETALPYIFSERPNLSWFVEDFVYGHNNTSVLFGTVASQKEKNRHFLLNRIQLLPRIGKYPSSYDKQHLVPFGEYLPLPIRFEFLDNIFQGIEFTKGINSTNLTMHNLHKNFNESSSKIHIGPLICYEVIFPDLAQEQVANGAEFLVTVSNDTWFGRSSGPIQHLYLAILRGIEQQRPLIRSTNSGISAIVDSYGRIEQKTELFTETWITSIVKGEKSLSFYHLYGKKLEYLFLCIFLCSCFFVFLRFLFRNKLWQI